MLIGHDILRVLVHISDEKAGAGAVRPLIFTDVTNISVRGQIIHIQGAAVDIQNNSHRSLSGVPIVISEGRIRTDHHQRHRHHKGKQRSFEPPLLSFHTNSPLFAIIVASRSHNP